MRTCLYGFFSSDALDSSFFRHRGGERGETTTLTVERNGLFDIAVNKILRMDDLVPQTVFQCLLSIPDTHYSVKEETMYFPGKGIVTLSTTFGLLTKYSRTLYFGPDSSSLRPCRGQSDDLINKE